ncbi:MAG: U32 family peptidase C-terminal domain-containing protein, partial [Deltaproteobacteria bacterium]|nr:U32 family peptidase C-terminal domain-containing protein [Deltaproteobacteria bacterium]
SGKEYGLRSYAGNFTLSEMEEGIKFAHKRQVKVYVTVNIVARNDDFIVLPDYLNSLSELKVDGLIVSDPGIIAQARQHVPHLPLHLSTQLSTSNWCSAQFWQQQGISRINLARELSLEEIALIKQRAPVKIEIFVHGAMCISHSGRCLLSTYLTQRDPNRGECAHPCRWKYSLMEENRPNRYFPITEDEYGSYVFNSKDLCLIEYLPEIIAAGVDAIKIEGRMKGIHYVASVTRIYRRALDCYGEAPERYQFQAEWLEELKKISHRDYTIGFFLGTPSEESFRYDTSNYVRTHELVGVVKEVLPSTGEDASTDSARLVKLQVRNKITQGDKVEFIDKDLNSYHTTVEKMMNEKGEVLPLAQPGQEIVIRTNSQVGVNDLLRKKKVSS